MNIVFDVGNVLIRWVPERAVCAAYPDPDVARAWLKAVGFFEWNLRQDGGRGFDEGLAALEAAHPGAASVLGQYAARFGETIAEAIEGTWGLIDRLKAGGHRLFAITNFADYTWPVALAVHPRLASTFEDVVVSGYEHLLKPAPEIYRLLCSRNRLDAAQCLFIDDSHANVAGARAVGMLAHHFTTPELLEADLIARGLI